jgi:hypothetical protein
MSTIQTYLQDPSYFQRMLEFLLHSRFYSVRLHMANNKKKSVFFAIDGTLIDTRDKSRRFKTLTDWYNAIHKTSHALSFTKIFEKMYISNTVNIMHILKTVSQSEIDSFQDAKYRSNMAYNYIFRRIRVNCIECDWDQESFMVTWRGHTYTVSPNNTYSTDGGTLLAFLKNFWDVQEVPGLAICVSDGTTRPITEPITEPKEPEKGMEPEQPETVPKESLMEEWMRGEMKKWEALWEEREEKMQTFVQEHAEAFQENQRMRVEMEALREQVQALSSHVEILASQSNYMSGVLGQILTSYPPLSPGFPAFSAFPTLPTSPGFSTFPTSPTYSYPYYG